MPLPWTDVIRIDANPIYPIAKIRPVAQNAPGYLYSLGEHLDVLGPKAYSIYRAVMDRPVETKVGNIRIVTPAEKRKWRTRMFLVKWGLI